MGKALKLIYKEKPQVAAYHDYRIFLKDLLGYLGENGTSLRTLARNSKIGASSISMVIAGHRSLTAATLEQLLPHLGLAESEGKYLELLRALSEEPTPEKRSAALGKLQKLKAYRELHPQEFKTFHFLSSWYAVAIREMSLNADFKADAKWIQSRLREMVPLEDIEKALAFLRDNGFLQKQPVNLECMGGVFKLALRGFHREMLTQAADAIEKVESDDRHILGHTLAIAEAQLPELKKILDEALGKIEQLSLEVKASDSVYHVSLAAVPLTAKKGKSE
jgi:uncharacterized protein (TIGR02147 family)